MQYCNSRLHHFLTLERLPRNVLLELMDTAERYINNGKVEKRPLLEGKTLVNLFFEASTRTRATFEMAAQKLGANVINLDVARSSAQKGESLSDTVKTLAAMQIDYLVIRHGTSGAAKFVAQVLGNKTAVVNAGDGPGSHPTQALLDMLTLKQQGVDFPNLSVAIMGDILHSRVARSQIHALQTLGVADLRLIGPPTLVPDESVFGTRVFTSREEGLKDVDVIILLRLQHERMDGAFLPSLETYYRDYALTEQALNLANENALILHPGPMNRDVEIQSHIAESANALMLKQVTNGIAMRMAILSTLKAF